MFRENPTIKKLLESVSSTFLHITLALRSVSGVWSATTSTNTGFLTYLALSQRVKKVLFQGVNLGLLP
jgi:hypothetical protein